MNFEQLIAYCSGKASPEEAMAVDAWISETPEHKAYFDNLHQSWLEAGDEAYHQPNVAAAWRALQSKINTGRKPVTLKRRFAIKYGIAAGLLFLIGIGYYFFNQQKQSRNGIVTNTGATPQKIILPDSSVAVLQAGSQLMYNPASFSDHRIIALQGDASFEIVHNAGHELVIQMGELSVKDIGTRFSIHQLADSTMVIVTEGEVAFYNKKDSMNLQAGATGTFRKNETTFIAYRPVMTGSFAFNDVALADVATALEAHFKVHIIFQNDGIKANRFTSNLKEKSLHEILNIIGATFNLKYNVNGNEVFLSEAGNK